VDNPRNDIDLRARRHAALGDPIRLAVVDALGTGDLTSKSLGSRLGTPGNLLAHHLGVLEEAGLVTRRVSEGDRRRRYVVLRHDALARLIPHAAVPAGRILFVCTHNSARSQFARALWTARTGRDCDCAGTQPAPRVHPLAVRVAAEHGLDLSGERPRGYASVDAVPALVVSVCDRAGEAQLPAAQGHLHWAIPDPVRTGGPAAFRRAFEEIATRIERLAVAGDDTTEIDAPQPNRDRQQPEEGD